MDVFSPSYKIARKRFREAAIYLEADVESFTIYKEKSNSEELTIDFAFVGNRKARWIVVISSGLHGIEGFFGSAVQLAWMQKFANDPKFLIDNGGAILLVHGINPYGFAFLRRTNEDNIDLNRNYLQANEFSKITSTEYLLIDHFLNPKKTETKINLFYIRLLLNIVRYGLPTIKQAIAGGQYDFEKGIFFGGFKEAKSTLIIKNFLPMWLDKAEYIIHLDFHTGLGKWARYQLFPAKSSTLYSKYTKFFDQFGLKFNINQAPYKCRGSMGGWLFNSLSHKNYFYFNAEFGTYTELKVLEILRAENIDHFYSKFKNQWIKERLFEVFCPKNHKWRKDVIVEALDLINKAIEVCSEIAK